MPRPGAARLFRRRSREQLIKRWRLSEYRCVRLALIIEGEAARNELVRRVSSIFE